MAEFTSTETDPKGATIVTELGKMGKPGIRLGTPYSPERRIDGMKVSCVEVAHDTDCDNPALTMFPVGGGDSDVCVKDGKAVGSVGDGTKFSWSGPGCLADENSDVWNFFPPVTASKRM